MIQFYNANSRDTYFSIHKIHNAHKYSTGKDVSIGIIDRLFAFNDNMNLYSGCVDVSGVSDQSYKQEGHGHWMANTLREIAPDCQIFAINGITYESEEKRLELLEKSIEWAIENHIHILTYSHPKFSDDYRTRVDRAIKLAYDNGIITTFINNDSEYNLWPYGCLEFFDANNFARLPDVNIYHYDYNVLRIDQYEAYINKTKHGEPVQSGDDIPFFSFSSMSPVLAGFVAILKQLAPSLSFEQIKTLLVSTSYSITDKQENWYDLNPCKNVVDMEKAVLTLNNKQKMR